MTWERGYPHRVASADAAAEDVIAYKHARACAQVTSCSAKESDTAASRKMIPLEKTETQNKEGGKTSSREARAYLVQMMNSN